MRYVIPVAQPVLGKDEEKLVLKGIRSGWISSIGKYINQFENKFAKFCDTKYGITTSSGTTALHLSLVAADIKTGDEVIVPSMTFVATANAVTYTGAKPIFVDSEFESWNIDPEKIKEKINKKTKAIIPVHLYGHPAKMAEIMAIAKKYGLLVIEDAAEAHGAMYRNKKVGSIGDAACFSFYGNKIITTGEGGMILTNNKSFAQKTKQLRDHGVSNRRKYYYPHLGFNYRMTNLQAAIGVAQLKKIDSIIAKKRLIAIWYQKYLEGLVPEIVFQPEAKWAKKVFWMFSILVNKKGKKNRDYLVKELKKRGIDSRPFFFPLHKLPRYKTGEIHPISEFLGYSGLNLPSSIDLSEEKIAFICKKIIEIWK